MRAWIKTIPESKAKGALRESRDGADATLAAALAEEFVAGVQGGIVLARALHDPATFGRIVARTRLRMGIQPGTNAILRE